MDQALTSKQRALRIGNHPLLLVAVFGVQACHATSATVQMYAGYLAFELALQLRSHDVWEPWASKVAAIASYSLGTWKNKGGVRTPPPAARQSPDWNAADTINAQVFWELSFAHKDRFLAVWRPTVAIALRHGMAEVSKHCKSPPREEQHKYISMAQQLLTRMELLHPDLVGGGDSGDERAEANGQGRGPQPRPQQSCGSRLPPVWRDVEDGQETPWEDWLEAWAGKTPSGWWAIGALGVIFGDFLMSQYVGGVRYV